MDVEQDLDMDLDTAQAQVDMSMALINDLVSGWMKTSNAKLPSSASRGDEEKELDEYMRRPPRLGVGAPVPGSSDMRSRDTAKLRSKLAGNGKKRGREEDEVGMGPGQSAVVISDDEEEGRARVVAKKARVDPFAPKQKENKKTKARANIDHPSATTSSPAKTASPSKSKTATQTSPAQTAVSPKKVTDKEEPANKYSDIEEIPRPPDTGTVATVLSKSAKRKKKKKHKTTAGAEPDIIMELEPSASPSKNTTPAQPKSTSPLQSKPSHSQITKPLQPKATIVPASTPAPVLAPALAPAPAPALALAPAPPSAPLLPTNKKPETTVIKAAPTPSSSFLASALAKAKSILNPFASGAPSASASAPPTPTQPAHPEPVHHPEPSPQARRLDALGKPLLNLTGPPPEVVEVVEEVGAARKRRKKRKKKRRQGVEDAAAHAEVIDVDADVDEGEGADVL